MGERVHWHRNDVSDPACGVRAREGLWNWTFSKNPRLVTCPGCREALRSAGMEPRPTILTFRGETGGDGCGYPTLWRDDYADSWLVNDDGKYTAHRHLPGIPAPAPEAQS